jgi:hypothetical protein
MARNDDKTIVLNFITNLNLFLLIESNYVFRNLTKSLYLLISNLLTSLIGLPYSSFRNFPKGIVNFIMYIFHISISSSSSFILTQKDKSGFSSENPHTATTECSLILSSMIVFFLFLFNIDLHLLCDWGYNVFWTILYLIVIFSYYMHNCPKYGKEYRIYDYCSRKSDQFLDFWRSLLFLPEFIKYHFALWKKMKESIRCGCFVILYVKIWYHIISKIPHRLIMNFLFLDIFEIHSFENWLIPLQVSSFCIH